MPALTRRQRRYQRLRMDFGFCKFEATELSHVPFNTPYMDALIKQRFRLFQKSITEGKSRAEFDKEIRREYIQQGWRQKTGVRSYKFDPWAMLRHFEHEYKQKHPNYQSPWKKRRQRWVNFTAKVEFTMKKNRDQWIQELEVNIAQSTGARRAQLEKQRDRLMRLK